MASFDQLTSQQPSSAIVYGLSYHPDIDFYGKSYIITKQSIIQSIILGTVPFRPPTKEKGKDILTDSTYHLDWL